MSFDFHYYPLVYRAGREGDAIPGLQVLSAPAISNRHRQHDLLALLLTISGDHRYDPEEIQALTLEAGQAFFQVQGSVTRALQAVADTLNKQIFDRNLDRGYEGVRALGALNLAVLHNDWLFLGQVGRTQAVFITSENVEFFAEPPMPVIFSASAAACRCDWLKWKYSQTICCCFANNPRLPGMCRIWRAAPL